MPPVSLLRECLPHILRKRNDYKENAGRPRETAPPCGHAVDAGTAASTHDNHAARQSHRTTVPTCRARQSRAPHAHTVAPTCHTHHNAVTASYATRQPARSPTHAHPHAHPPGEQLVTSYRRAGLSTSARHHRYAVAAHCGKLDMWIAQVIHIVIHRHPLKPCDTPKTMWIRKSYPHF